MVSRQVYTRFAMILVLLIVMVAPHAWAAAQAAASDSKPLIYDQAGLLNPEQRNELEELANRYGAKRDTDIVILTTNNADNVDVVKLTEDFYDNKGLGYDKQHGNAVILTLDMKNRDVYLAGFYQAEKYLDSGRLDKIRNKITPKLSNGDYNSAFRTYIQTAYRYMGVKPGVNPDNILFNGWFQLAVSVVVGAIIVGWMAYNSGGRVTVNRKTYEDTAASGVLQSEDQYIRTSVSKVRVRSNNNSSGMGGGGGITGGGHSHSGSRGKF